MVGFGNGDVWGRSTGEHGESGGGGPSAGESDLLSNPTLGHPLPVPDLSASSHSAGQFCLEQHSSASPTPSGLLMDSDPAPAEAAAAGPPVEPSPGVATLPSAHPPTAEQVSSTRTQERMGVIEAYWDS